MNTPADRDYIDAKAEAIAASLSVNAMEYQATTNTHLDGMSARLDEMNARLDALEQTMQAGFKSIREELTTQLAQLETRIARTQAENFKWMLGAVIGGIAISTSFFTVLLNSGPQKAPMPIVIYAQPNVK